MIARRLVVVVAGLAIAGCATSATPSPSVGWPPLGVDNETSVALAVVVNGGQLAVIPPHTLQSPVTATFPPRPWSIEVRSPSGRPLLTLDYADSTVAKVARADLSCGRVDLWVGGGPPGGGPAFMPGPSPCD
jgi:hypothetical protein